MFEKNISKYIKLVNAVSVAASITRPRHCPWVTGDQKHVKYVTYVYKHGPAKPSVMGTMRTSCFCIWADPSTDLERSLVRCLLG